MTDQHRLTMEPEARRRPRRRRGAPPVDVREREERLGVQLPGAFHLSLLGGALVWARGGRTPTSGRQP